MRCQSAGGSFGLESEFLELSFDGFGPDLVALLFGMKGVGHDFLGEDSFFSEELVGDIEVVDALAVVEFRDELVDLNVVFALWIIWVDASREDSKEEDFCLGAAGADG